MANFLLGAAKGFADAAHADVVKIDEFNRDLEKAARINAMQAHAEQQKIYDKASSLAAGTPLAMFYISQAGGNWDSLDPQDQSKMSQYAKTNRDELIRQLAPRKAPTYDNYQESLKRPKIIDYLRDKIGVTPKYAYARSKAMSDIDEAKSAAIPAIELGGNEKKYIKYQAVGNKLLGIKPDGSVDEVYNPESGKDEMVGDVDTFEAGIMHYLLRGEKPPEMLVNAYVMSKKSAGGKVDYINMHNPKTGQDVLVEKGSEEVAQRASEGFIKAGDVSLNAPNVDYKNLMPPAKAYLDSWVMNNKDIEVDVKGITAEQKAQRQQIKDVATQLFEWRKGSEKGEANSYDAIVTSMAGEFNKLKSVVDDEQNRWKQSLYNELSKVSPGKREALFSAFGHEVPSPFKSEGSYDIGNKIKQSPEQRALGVLTPALQDIVKSGIYKLLINKKTGEFKVVNGDNQEITSGKY